MNLTEALRRADWSVVDELHHIPHGPKGSSQEALRTEFAAFRSIHKDLGANLPARAALIQAIYNVKRFDPDFRPRYDSAYFFEGSAMSSTLAQDELAQEIHAIAADGGGGASRPSTSHSTARHEHAEVVEEAAVVPAASRGRARR